MIYKTRPTNKGQEQKQNVRNSHHSYHNTAGRSMVNDDPVIEEVWLRHMKDLISIQLTSCLCIILCSYRLCVMAMCMYAFQLSSDSEEQPHPKHRHHLMGNEIAVPSSRSVPPSSSGVSESPTSSVVNSSPHVRRLPPSSRSQPHDLLGNEVHMEHPSSVSGGKNRERRVYTRENSYPLGNEVTPPGINNLGNEVSVGIREGIGARSKVATTPSQGEKGHSGQVRDLLGNEVSMPGNHISKKLPGSKDPPSQSLPMSLGNEVPMPATARMGSVGGVSSRAVVDNGLSLPAYFGGGKSQLVTERDSGYTTTASPASDTASVHSTSSASSVTNTRRPRNKPHKSDSSSDSLQNLTLHPSSRPGVLSPQTERESIVTSDSRCSSNDLSSDEPVPSMSVHSYTTQVHNQPPLPNVHYSATSAKPHLVGNRIGIENNRAMDGGGSGGSIGSMGSSGSVVIVKNNSVELDDEEENNLDEEEDEEMGEDQYCRVCIMITSAQHACIGA